MGHGIGGQLMMMSGHEVECGAPPQERDARWLLAVLRDESANQTDPPRAGAVCRRRIRSLRMPVVGQ
jgi:hypothetical protein